MISLTRIALLFTLLIAAWPILADDENGPRTGYFRSSTTPLELLGERGAQALAEVFAADEALSWQLDVPDNYDPRNPPGAIVFINRGNWGGGKKVWSSVLEEKNLIWIGAIDAGDKAPMNERMLKGILATALLSKHYAIDPQRVYVAGFSGGAHVANILATTRPEVFRGGLFMSGAVFWGDTEPPKIEQVRRNRFVFLAGANDISRIKVSRTADSYRDAGVQNTQLIVVANTRQELPGPSYFAKAIDYLDGKLE
jgi:hypothetical protein